MKGVIFTEFLGMVEQAFSADMVDDLIDATNPASKGAYTTVGTYDHAEIVAMVVELSRRTNTPVPALLEAFGGHLFGRFHELYPTLMPPAESTFDFLESIEALIHVEVLKLYPDAQLPHLATVRHSDDQLTLTYRSPRGMQDLALGLIKGCGSRYGESLEITSETLANGDVVFDIRKA